MITLKIVEKKVDQNKYYYKKWIVKNGRKKFAEIHQKTNNYSVTINGLQWNKANLTECINHCNEFVGNFFFSKVIFCKIPTEK